MGLTHRATSTMLRGHGCRMEHRIGIVSAMWPLVALKRRRFRTYIHLRRSMNQSRSPYAFRMVKSYRCEILSNASWKSKDNMHRGLRVTSDCALSSLTVGNGVKNVITRHIAELGLLQMFSHQGAEAARNDSGRKFIVHIEERAGTEVLWRFRSIVLRQTYDTPCFFTG